MSLIAAQMASGVRAAAFLEQTLELGEDLFERRAYKFCARLGERKPLFVWNGCPWAPAEGSVKSFSRLRRRAERALDRPFVRRVLSNRSNRWRPVALVSVLKNFCGSPWPSGALPIQSKSSCFRLRIMRREIPAGY
jgi:hypothetical protein